MLQDLLFEPLDLLAEQFNRIHLLRGHKSKAIVVSQKLRTLRVAELLEDTPVEALACLPHGHVLQVLLDGGVAGTKIWNNIVISNAPSVMACQMKKQQLNVALVYMDYNVYDAEPLYDFGEYTSKRQHLSFDQMQSEGFEKNSHVVSSAATVFEDEKSYKLLPKWETAGRDGDDVGPENTALILDTTRYGLFSIERTQSPNRPCWQNGKKTK
jgi:hypothetical protein